MDASASAMPMNEAAASRGSQRGDHEATPELPPSDAKAPASDAPKIVDVEQVDAPMRLREVLLVHGEVVRRQGLRDRMSRGVLQADQLGPSVPAEHVQPGRPVSPSTITAPTPSVRVSAPTTEALERRVARVDEQRGAGDERGRRRSEKNDRTRDLDGLSHAAER